MAKTKINLVTEIKDYTKKIGQGLFSISIGTVKLSEEQRDLIDGLIDNKEKVKLSIEIIQGHLPGME